MTTDAQTSEAVETSPVDYAAGAERPNKRGKGFLALAGTLIFPGLGHVLIGRFRRAVFWAVLAAAWDGAALGALTYPKGFPIALLAGLAAVATALTALIDAFLCGRASPRRLLGRPWRRYAAGVGLIAAALSISPLSFTRYDLSLFIRRRYTEAHVIASSSMSPALRPGDLILVHKREECKRWSVVTFEHPQYGASTIVSRVVGLPGETVEIVDGQLMIDGVPNAVPPGVGPYTSLDYDWAAGAGPANKPGAGCKGNPIHLGRDEYFVLGDNSPRALDARVWTATVPGHQLGALPRRLIKGRVTWIYWPPSRWQYFD